MSRKVMQATIREGQLHLQGAGDSINRPYGVSVYFPLAKSDELKAWLAEQPKMLSLTGSGRTYREVKVKVGCSDFSFGPYTFTVCSEKAQNEFSLMKKYFENEGTVQL